MGNLVSSCGSPASSPSSPTPKNNSKNTIPKTNTPPPPGPAPAPSPSPVPSNSKANANANKNTAITTKKGVSFGNTNTRNIKNINAQMKKTPKPNLTKTAESSVLNPSEAQANIQEINPKANTVLEKSIKKAIKPGRLAKPVAQGLTELTTPENKEALLKNEENEATIIDMTTNTNPKPANEGYRTLGTKPAPAGPSMDGGRRRKTRKQRKHRK
jgi:hypothetical protein